MHRGSVGRTPVGSYLWGIAKHGKAFVDYPIESRALGNPHQKPMIACPARAGALHSRAEIVPMCGIVTAVGVGRNRQGFLLSKRCIDKKSRGTEYLCFLTASRALADMKPLK